MGTLTVWKFDSADGADRATETLADLSSKHLITIGAASGALAGSLKDVGIDDRFIDRVRAEVTPGTSALFVMSSDAVVDKVRDAFAAQRPELVFTNLSEEQETAIREVFAE